MSLFKKKEPREIKEDDKLIVKLWYNKRTHAMIVLGIYLFIFLILFVLAKIATMTTKVTNNGSNKETITAFTKRLDESNLMVNYSITNGNKKYYYSGQKITNTNVIKGSFLYDGSSTDAYLVSDKCFDKVVNIDDPSTYTTNEKACPSDINYSLLDYNYINKILKGLNGKFIGEKYCTYHLNDELTIKLYYENNNINKIEIANGKTTYELVYEVVDNSFDPRNDENILTEIAKEAVKLSYDQRYYSNRRRIKIAKDTYIENLLKLVSDNTELTDVYQITIDSITEYPINININAKSKTNAFTITLNSENFNPEEYVKE